jgi:hypothetical protein
MSYRAPSFREYEFKYLMEGRTACRAGPLDGVRAGRRPRTLEAARSWIDLTDNRRHNGITLPGLAARVAFENGSQAWLLDRDGNFF